MTEAVRPSLLAIVRAAVDATGAGSGWLLRGTERHFVVVAAVGTMGTPDSTGSLRAHQGAAGYAFASGQPAALQVRPDDRDNFGAGNAAGVPASVLAAPCSGEDVVGVLELADAPGGGFSFDDVETVVLLSDIAGAALTETSAAVDAAPTPAELAARLATLSQVDPARYSVLARAIGAML